MNILPDLVKVSRNCGYTQDLSKIIESKFDEKELHILIAWLHIVEEERRNRPNSNRHLTSY